MLNMLRLGGLAAAIACSGGFAHADEFSARLSGFQEIGGLGAGETGAILSNGTGTLSLDVGTSSIKYKLTFSGTATTVAQAHIHFAKVHVAGGIMVFLCTNLGNGPAGTPACPVSGTVTGTLTAASVVGPTAQNVTPGDFNALLSALDSNTAYVNVHTSQFPSGEIRGQIRRGDRGDD
jgi:hypothetical protein